MVVVVAVVVGGSGAAVVAAVVMVVVVVAVVTILANILEIESGRELWRGGFSRVRLLKSRL